MCILLILSIIKIIGCIFELNINDSSNCKLQPQFYNYKWYYIFVLIKSLKNNQYIDILNIY